MKKGYWVDCEDGDHRPYRVCSRCDAWFDGHKKEHYCSSCGAKMYASKELLKSKRWKTAGYCTFFGVLMVSGGAMGANGFGCDTWLYWVIGVAFLLAFESGSWVARSDKK